jgi:hypothetical protein
MSSAKRPEPKLDLDKAREKLARLGLEHVANQLEEKLSAAARDEIPPYRFLDAILDDELGSREERRILVLPRGVELFAPAPETRRGAALCCALPAGSRRLRFS